MNLSSSSTLMKSNFVSPDAKLVDVVTQRLEAAGHARPSAWQTSLNPNVHTEPDQGLQRFFINRCLRLVIGEVPDNTLAVRTCLIDDGSTSDWLRYLDKAVIPCMVQYQLPLLTATA